MITNMKRISISFIFIITTITLFAQGLGGRGSVSGVVLEKLSGGSNEPVIQATAVLKNPKDSTLVTGAVTDLDGKFSINNLKWGTYVLEVSYVGLKPIIKNITLSARQAQFSAGELILESDMVNLGEVVVTAKPTEVIVKTDTVDFNPNAFTQKENDVVEDLLKKLPGVEVSDDGTITYAGKPIEKILIDGKEFFVGDPQIASKNIPVEIIERLQVIDDRSDDAKRTGVDDGERQKVINLSIKKDRKKGWFGDVQAGYGTEERYGGKAMVNRFVGEDKFTLLMNSNNVNNMGFSDRGGNMRGGGQGGIITSHGLGANIIKEFGSKVKTAGNINLNASDSDNRRNTSRETILQDSSMYTESASSRLAKGQNINFNYRIEFNPDTMNYFIFTPSFNYSHNTVDSYSDSRTSGRTHLLNTGTSKTYNENNSFNGGLRMDYVHRFKKQGRAMGVNLSGNIGSGTGNGTNIAENEFYKDGVIDSTSMLDQYILNRSDSKNVRASVFYTEPLMGKQNYLQFRYTFRWNQNGSEKDTYNDPLYSDLDTTYSRGNINNFINHQIGLTYRVVREKYRYAIGASVEPSSTQSKSYVREKVLADLPTRNVVNFSPNAMFRYRFSSTSDLNARYNGRMQQPSATQLLPVRDVSNPLNIVVGNPDLLPSFTHDANIEFNRSTPEKQTTISTEIGWSMTENSIVSNTFVEPNGVRTTTYDNVNGVWNVYGRFMASLPFKNKRFQFNTFTFLRYGNNVGYSNGNRNVSSSTSISETLMLRYRIDKLLEMGVRFNGRYSEVVNSLQKSSDRQTIDYTGSYFFTLFLPANITLGSDIRYNGNWGYTAGYEKKEWIWNAEVSKSFLKGKNAIVTLRAYDILGQMTNISRNTGGNYIEDATFNALTSYAMLSFTYKFNTFGGNIPGGGDSGRRGPGGPRPY